MGHMPWGRCTRPAVLILSRLRQVPIDLVGLGDPDYYISNGHKWLFSPKGSVSDGMILRVRRSEGQAGRCRPSCTSDQSGS